MNSVVRDKTKTIVFDEDDEDDIHPYIKMVERIKELMALKGISKDEITNNTALYELYKILNNVILSAPPINKYDYIVLYRGERTYTDDLMKHNINDTYVNKGIWSTSLDPYTAGKFAGAFLKNKKGYVINILVPAALNDGKKTHILPIKDCSMEEDEFEVLLPSKCTFLVIDKIMNDPESSINKITLLLIDQPDKDITILKQH